MELYLQYMIKFSIVVSAFYLLYMFLLRKVTFYRWIRIYFLSAMLVAAILPLIDFDFLFPVSPGASIQLLRSIPVVSDIPYINSHDSSELNSAVIVSGIILAVSAMLGCRLLIQLISLAGLKRNSVLVRREIGIKFYEPKHNISSFSFGRLIFINSNNSNPDQLEHIIAHEKVHVEGFHTADILIMELVCVLNWYNPFVWLMKKALRQNLEYIADEAVVTSGFNPKAYQYTMLQSASGTAVPLTSSFSMFNIKKRIAMMNTTQSSKTELFKFTAVLPVLLLISLLFRQNDAFAQSSDSGIKLSSESGVYVKGDFKDGKPLFIIDGIVQPATFDLKLLKPTDIKAMTVWKGDSAISKFGRKAVHGAIEIETSLPLIVIDGKIQGKVSNLDQLVKSEDVESMNVIKTDAATAKYGQSAKNGVIEIILKKR